MAEVLVERILEAVGRLAAFPRSGRVVPEQERQDIREILVSSYRIMYEVAGERVNVLMGRHAAQLVDLDRLDPHSD